MVVKLVYTMPHRLLFLVNIIIAGAAAYENFMYYTEVVSFMLSTTYTMNIISKYVI